GSCRAPASQADCSALLGIFGTQACPPEPGPDLYATSVKARQEFSELLRFDGRTGAPKPSPGNAGALFVARGTGGTMFPLGLAFGEDGLLYVANIARNSVMRFDAAGAPAGIAGDKTDATFVLGGASNLAFPSDLVFGP